MKPRFKIGDLISGSIDIGKPNIVALILSYCDCDRDDLSGYEGCAVYKVVVGGKLMNLQTVYVDHYFEKLNET